MLMAARCYLRRAMKAQGRGKLTAENWPWIMPMLQWLLRTAPQQRFLGRCAMEVVMGMAPDVMFTGEPEERGVRVPEMVSRMKLAAGLQRGLGLDEDERINDLADKKQVMIDAGEQVYVRRRGASTEGMGKFDMLFDGPYVVLEDYGNAVKLGAAGDDVPELSGTINKRRVVIAGAEGTSAHGGGEGSAEAGL